MIDIKRVFKKQLNRQYPKKKYNLSFVEYYSDSLVSFCHPDDSEFITKNYEFIDFDKHNIPILKLSWR